MSKSFNPDTCKHCKSTKTRMTMNDKSQIGIFCLVCNESTFDDTNCGMTAEEIEAGKSPKGGWTKQTLLSWGVPYPPPKGWKEDLIAGRRVIAKQKSANTADDLLRELCVHLIETGRGKELEQFPDLLAHFGARLPTPIEAVNSGLRNDAGPWN